MHILLNFLIIYFKKHLNFKPGKIVMWPFEREIPWPFDCQQKRVIRERLTGPGNFQILAESPWSPVPFPTVTSSLLAVELQNSRMNLTLPCLFPLDTLMEGLMSNKTLQAAGAAQPGPGSRSLSNPPN